MLTSKNAGIRRAAADDEVLPTNPLSSLGDLDAVLRYSTHPGRDTAKFDAPIAHAYELIFLTNIIL
jgi:hypothetical protein